jgi:hypothetical protein
VQATKQQPHNASDAQLVPNLGQLAMQCQKGLSCLKPFRGGYTPTPIGASTTSTVAQDNNHHGNKAASEP